MSTGPRANRCKATEEEMRAFYAQVRQLRSEGLGTHAIAERLSVSIFTLRDRVRRWQKRSVTAS